MSDVDWKARAETAEKENNEFRRALDRGATMETISVEARSEINHWRGRAEAAEQVDAWEQRNAIYAELVKVQARAEAAERERDGAGIWVTRYRDERDAALARAEAAEKALAESEEKSDQRLKMALEWKRSRDDYYERLEAAEKRVTELVWQVNICGEGAGSQAMRGIVIGLIICTPFWVAVLWWIKS